MGKSRKLEVLISGDASGASKAFGQAAKEAEGFGEKLSKVGSKMRAWGAGMTAGVTAPLLLAANSAVDAAASYDDSANRIRASLGPLADDTLKWADSLLETHGVGKKLATDMVGSFADMLTAQGKTKKEAVALAQSYVKLTADAASYYDLPHEEVQSAIQAGLRGEYEQLEKLNVFLKESDVQKRALLDTGKKRVTDLNEQEKAAARNKLIMEGLAKVEGDYAKTADSVNNQVRQQQQQLENLKIEIGDKLIPVKQQLLEWTGKVLDKFSELSPESQNLALKIGAVSAAVGPLLMGVGLLIPAIEGLSKAAMWLYANPVGLLIGALALLAAGLVIAYQRSEGFRTAVDLAADAIQVGFATAIRTGIVILQQMVGGLLLAAESALTWGAAIVGWSTPAGRALRGAREDISRTRGHINNELTAIIDRVDTFIQAHTSQALEALGYVSYQLDLLDGRVVHVRTVADTGNILSGRRAHGGPVAAARAYLVGERGPEVFVPSSGGEIIPNHRLAAASVGGGVGGLGAGPVVVNNHYSVEVNAGTVADERKLTEMVMRGLRDHVRSSGLGILPNELLRELRRRR